MIKIMSVEERSKYPACQVCLKPHPKYFVPVKTAQGVVTAALCNKCALIYAYEEEKEKKMFDYLDPVVTVTTPEEFAKEMRAIVARNTKTSSFCPEDGPTLDLEDCHWEHDRLMCKVLIELGYLEGVEVFNNTKKWYA